MKKIWAGIAATLCVGVAAGAMTSNAVTASAAPSLFYERVTLDNPPACALTLEELKVKNMTYWEYCRVDDEYDAWYFMAEGGATERTNPEIRFVVDGVQTVTKPYDLPPMTVGAFSFDYCIVNDSPSGVADLADKPYIVQILGADGTYPVIEVDVEEDGYWHTVSVDSDTAFYGALGTPVRTYGEFNDQFCGFLFKMGCLDGEFMIKDIVLYDVDGNVIEPEVEVPDLDEDSADSDLSNDISDESEQNSDVTDSIQNDSVSSDSVSSDNVESDKASSTPIVFPAKKKGCGSFGVGAMTLGSLAVAGVVLSVGKRKRK